MEPIQHHQRHIAAQEFQKSLDQLEGILQEHLTGEEITLEANTSNIKDIDLSENSEEIDLAAFEDAVADIEQYLERKTKKL
jgi:hypothetical protein